MRDCRHSLVLEVCELSIDFLYIYVCPNYVVIPIYASHHLKEKHNSVNPLVIQLDMIHKTGVTELA